MNPETKLLNFIVNLLTLCVLTEQPVLFRGLGLANHNQNWLALEVMYFYRSQNPGSVGTKIHHKVNSVNI